jgi:hypothetical protein
MITATKIYKMLFLFCLVMGIIAMGAPIFGLCKGLRLVYVIPSFMFALIPFVLCYGVFELSRDAD